MDKLTSLRWLAREVVPEAAVAVASVPAPVLASANRKTTAIRQYLAWWIYHPDPSGHFAAKMRWLRWLPSSILIRILFALGYDGLIFMEGDTVVGHIFYQRRGAEIHDRQTGRRTKQVFGRQGKIRRRNSRLSTRSVPDHRDRSEGVSSWNGSVHPRSKGDHFAGASPRALHG